MHTEVKSQGSDPHLDAIKISVFLRAARTAVGLTQVDLALQLGISQSAIARCERGAGTIPANVLLRAIRIFSGYGVDISSILERSPSMKIDESFFINFASRFDEDPLPSKVVTGSDEAPTDESG